jgi:hypothetical protein
MMVGKIMMGIGSGRVIGFGIPPRVSMQEIDLLMNLDEFSVEFLDFSPEKSGILHDFTTDFWSDPQVFLSICHQKGEQSLRDFWDDKSSIFFNSI